MKKLLFALVAFVSVTSSCVKKNDDLLPTVNQPGIKVEVSTGTPGEVVPTSGSILLFEYTATASESGLQVLSQHSPKMKFSIDLTDLYLMAGTAMRPSINSYTAGTEVQLALNWGFGTGPTPIKVYGKINQNAASLPNTFQVQLLKGGTVTSTNSNQTSEFVKQDIIKTVNIRTTPSPATVSISANTPTQSDYMGQSMHVFEYNVTMAEAGWQITSGNSPKWVFNQDLSNLYVMVNGVQKTASSTYTAGDEIQINSAAGLNNGLNKIKLYVTPSNANTMLDVKLLKGGFISNSAGKMYELITTELNKQVDVKDKRFVVAKDNSQGDITINRVDTAAFKLFGQFTMTNTGILLAKTYKVIIGLTQDGTTKLSSSTLPKLSDIKGLRLVGVDGTYTTATVNADNTFTFNVLVPAGTTKTFKVEGKILSANSGQFICTETDDVQWTNYTYQIGNVTPLLLQTVTVQ